MFFANKLRSALWMETAIRRTKITLAAGSVLAYRAVAFAVVLAASFWSRSEAAGGAATPQPLVTVSITPAGEGPQLVRVSLPFRRGTLRAGQRLVARAGQVEAAVAVRPLTFHGGAGDAGCVRRALVTFPWEFRDERPLPVDLLAAAPSSSREGPPFETDVQVVNDVWRLRLPSNVVIAARPLWPAMPDAAPWQREVIERNEYVQWERWKRQGERWGQVVELRADVTGQIVLIAHLQRRETDEDWAPEFGWDLQMVGESTDDASATPVTLPAGGELPLAHRFASGEPYEYLDPSSSLRIGHPAAAWNRRGAVFAENADGGALRYRYLRCEGDDQVPHQRYAWRRAEIVVGPTGVSSPTATLASPHAVRADWKHWDALYRVGPPLDVAAEPSLRALAEFHRDATVACAATGDDWGNLTTFDAALQRGGVNGMNRLNHCPAIFFEAMRTGDHQLQQTALAWCDNYYDLSIWWGPEGMGGTRYNNVRARNETPPNDDRTFMWRSDDAVDFCTKGFSALLLAYEETGDPRMKEAFEAQVVYANQHVRCNDDEARNIGDVLDYVRLYEYAGEQTYLEHAVRLFRELRPALGPNNLFSQDGKPMAADPPFIDDDLAGKKHPFAKPYIIGYGLSGCPALTRYAPGEPRLKDMVTTVADFMAESQDPIGGWRYPHPRSSSVVTSQALEHAWQLVQVGEAFGPNEKHLDAIERVLRQRLWTWKASGQVLNLIHGWEASTGRITEPLEIYRLYRSFDDRDARRDYAQGTLGREPCSPESLVYFPEVLRFYLQHRGADRLLAPPAAGEPLHEVAARLSGEPMLQSRSVRDGLPVVHERLAQRLSFPLAWEKSRWPSFQAWQDEVRQFVRETWLAPPPDAAFAAAVLETRQCDGYQSQRIVFNLSGDSRVRGYILIPDGTGPFPAVLLLHDHGGEQRIGKEKVVEPWAEDPARMELARRWANEYYGGRFLGDELARRGYVCLAVDALNWSDRGGAGQKGQQQLASNLLHFGASLAGTIAYEDMRAAAFLAQRPEVDRRRIAAMGLSMGSFRAWQLAAMSPDISAGVAVCWMATVKGLMIPDGNQTEGQSAFTMTHPGLLSQLDYPHVASLACPKPMLFYNGRSDKLFPVSSVEAAYQTMQDVWKSQGADDRLVTKLWDAPHEFNRDMQEEAFDWLDQEFAKAP